MKTGNIKLASMVLAAAMCILFSGCGKKAQTEVAPAVNNSVVFQQTVDTYLATKSYGLKVTKIDVLKGENNQALVSCNVLNSSSKWEFTLKKDSTGAWTVTSFELK
ncbi:MAG: hypothetical protein ACYC4Q_02365 [Victivallaceae bacterium]